MALSGRDSSPRLSNLAGRRVNGTGTRNSSGTRTGHVSVWQRDGHDTVIYTRPLSRPVEGQRTYLGW